MIRSLLIASCLLIGCQSKVDGRPAATSSNESKVEKPVVDATMKTKQKGTQKTQVSKTVRPQKKARKKGTSIKWVDSLTWHSWEDAQSLSAKQGKPIMLLIYTNWCPRCRELAPLFTDSKIVEASEKFILVRQDQDERPDWLTQYRHLGGYVPRIIFFGTDGQPRDDVTSGRGKYPYFYTPRSQAALIRSMTKAATR